MLVKLYQFYNAVVNISIAHHSSIFPLTAPVGTLLHLTPFPSPERLDSPPLHVTMKTLEPGTLHAVFFLFF